MAALGHEQRDERVVVGRQALGLRQQICLQRALQARVREAPLLHVQAGMHLARRADAGLGFGLPASRWVYSAPCRPAYAKRRCTMRTLVCTLHAALALGLGVGLFMVSTAAC